MSKIKERKARNFQTDKRVHKKNEGGTHTFTYFKQKMARETKDKIEALNARKFTWAETQTQHTNLAFAATLRDRSHRCTHCNSQSE